MSEANPFLALLETGQPILSDGAMGTVLHSRGEKFDGCFDELNLSRPALVAEIHREYIEAGSQIIQTNTFGANRYKLSRHGLENEVARINTAGVELARRIVLASFKPVLIAGDVGPLGVRLAPFGRVKPEQARAAFAEQIAALAQAGVDLLIIETMSDLLEINEAILAAHEVAPGLPVIASMTFTRDDRTLLGDSPAKVAQSLQQAGATLIGINCSGGPNQILRILKQMRAVLSAEPAAFEVRGSAPLPVESDEAPRTSSGQARQAEPAAFEVRGSTSVSSESGEGPRTSSGQARQAEPAARFSVMPNAGWPEQAGGRIMYPAGPEYFGEYTRAFCAAGASVLGGCCGTTPQHIAAMAKALRNGACASLEGAASPDIVEMEETRSSDQPTQLAQKLAAGKFVVAVEMDPPRGLSTHKLLAGASLLAEAGADVINVADSPMARMRMSPWAVCNLIQHKTKIETVLHFPTRGRNLLRVQGDLLAAHALDVRNVFVVMGDPTAIGDYPNAMDNYDVVPSGLIKLIKQGFNAGVDHAGSDIGQPTSFFVGCALNLSPLEPDQEIKNLRRKLKAGADFLLTQPIFDPQAACAFLDQIHHELGPLPPILLGILPLVSSRHAAFLHNEVPGLSIPETIRARMAAASSDATASGDAVASGDAAASTDPQASENAAAKENAPAEGIKIAIELAEQMRPHVQGIYLMPPFNRFDYAAEIIEAVTHP